MGKKNKKVDGQMDVIPTNDYQETSDGLVMPNAEEELDGNTDNSFGLENDIMPVNDEPTSIPEVIEPPVNEQDELLEPDAVNEEPSEETIENTESSSEENKDIQEEKIKPVVNDNSKTSEDFSSNNPVVNPVLSWQLKEKKKLTKKEIILYSSIGGVVLIGLILCLYFFVIKKDPVVYEVELANYQVTLTQNEMIHVPVKNNEVEMIYKSNDTEVASVNERGLITALMPGSTTITVMPKLGGNKKNYAVTVVAADPEIVGKIEFAKASYTCKEGDIITTSIKVTSKEEDAEVLKFNVANSELAEMIDLVNSDDSKVTNIEIQCNYEGKTKLKTVSNTGASGEAELIVEHYDGDIRFDRPTYTCIEGDKIEAKVIAAGGNANNRVNKESFTSANKSVATVVRKQTANSDGKRETIVITCVKEGDTTISATSTSGAKATANVEVGSIYGKINLDKKSYSCIVGNTFKLKLTVSGGRPGNKVASFSSSDSSVAKLKDLTPSSPMNKTIQVQCLKGGTVTFKASSTAGASISATIKAVVDKGSVKFAKGSYSCKVGEKIKTNISVSGGPSSNKINNFSSSNSGIASIKDAGGSNTNKTVEISCSSVGSTTLNASNTAGASTSVNITVSPDNGTINFNKGSYSCTAGDTISASITVSGGGSSNSVTNFGSNNSSVATVTRDSADGKTLHVKIKCVSSGSTTLTATSATGMKASASISVASAPTPDPTPDSGGE